MRYGVNPETIRARYPAGTRIRLVSMSDPWPVTAGTMGTVLDVDDAGQVWMKWDSGRTLALIPGVDTFEVVSNPK